VESERKSLIFGRFPNKLCPRKPCKRPRLGPSSTCTDFQPRRPILWPFPGAPKSSVLFAAARCDIPGELVFATYLRLTFGWNFIF
jgi:hypothetical protein